MSRQKTDNLQRVLEAVPPGFLVDSAWLEANRIGRRSAYQYVRRGWLERLARGVFRRPLPGGRGPDRIDWRSCVLSMQHIMGYPVHVGAMSALALHGHRHYLPLGNESLWLHGDVLPNWLSRLPLDVSVVTRKTALFADPEIGLTWERGGQDPASQATVPWGWALRLSSPERAVLEVLDELPEHESFHNLEMVFQGLTTLRPKVLADLLSHCNKIKVKRLFFVFADYHGHAWRKRLNPDDFDLGRGDRALTRGGRLHPRYRIVVPEPYTRARGEGGTNA
ncbi:type IV toxin-antitoxin system AbiEi family antitoxin domain-containing protein [Gammaproteobacteria bacterium AB-CW1]|uniref:Type IV toxin-antitoxin system AbiEi family antitoxin domain-containing protein n=1 Tax=Natronospira elongata TaxID=3110268 RepID=A0AAP6JGS5_9GAMM|nr:type IV toxin-antitoxin system AbiEi family antitoxin domain-containing protein [Gammaproteobacteria bacterium AB-CW1]